MTVEQSESILEGYAARGVFRGLSRKVSGADQVTYRMLWHRDRTFDLVMNFATHTLRIPVVLPQVPAKSAMYRELREFIRGRQAKERLEHRRIDPHKAELRCSNRAGNAGLSVRALDGDMEYAIRKLIGLVQEIYMVFLYDGRYYDYMVEVFELDPDHM